MKKVKADALAKFFQVKALQLLMYVAAMCSP
jgi:hypothetical protein